MFKRNKAIKEYKNAIDKIKIPNIKGEEYITSINKREVKLLPIIKRSSIVFAAICVLMVFNIMSSDRFTNNNFSIKAYAGTNTIDIESGKIVELPSGRVDTDTFNMQGLLIESDKIKKISFDFDNGEVAYKRAYDYTNKEVMCYAPHGGFSSDIYGEAGALSVKFISDEVFNNMGNYDDEKVKEVRKSLGIDEEENLEDKYPPDYKGGHLYVSCTNFEVENEQDYLKHYILWIPNMQFLKDISEGKEIDYLNQRGVNIKFTITFKDDSEVTKNLNLSFNENGNLNCELD